MGMVAPTSRSIISTMNIVPPSSTKHNKLSFLSSLSENGYQVFSSSSACSYFSSECDKRIHNVACGRRSVVRMPMIQDGLNFKKRCFATKKLQAFNKGWKRFESLSMLHKCGWQNPRQLKEMKGYVSATNEYSCRLGEATNFTTAFSVLLFVAVLCVDQYSYHIIRRPLTSFHLTQPFAWATTISGLIGLVFVPLVKRLKLNQIFRKEGPSSHFQKSGTPTLGGLFFVPIGVLVASLITGFMSKEVWGVSAATLACATIGFVDDGLSFFRQHNYGLPWWLKLAMQVIVGMSFHFWLSTANFTSPYKMKNIVLLPPPFGPIYIGDCCYILLTSFCFAAMSNGVNLTDGLDGLAGGTAAAAFVGMAVAVIPLYPSLSIFGASMAGACIGFLFHNKHKASIFMGDTGSLALGGALAAMASCTGLFLPLLIASCPFAVEALSVIVQVANYRVTKRIFGVGQRIFRMAPYHHHLELSGLKELDIVLGAYIFSIFLAIVAAYVGLISVQP